MDCATAMAVKKTTTSFNRPQQTRKQDTIDKPSRCDGGHVGRPSFLLTRQSTLVLRLLLGRKELKQYGCGVVVVVDDDAVASRGSSSLAGSGMGWRCCDDCPVLPALAHSRLDVFHCDTVRVFFVQDRLKGSAPPTPFPLLPFLSWLANTRGTHPLHLSKFLFAHFAHFAHIAHIAHIVFCLVTSQDPWQS